MGRELKEVELHDRLDASKGDSRSGITKRRRSPRQPLSVFSKTAVVILIVQVTFLVSLGLAVRQPMVLIVAGIELLFVALIVAGIRWAPLLGSVLGGLMLFVFTSATGYPLHHLTHPKDAFGYGITPGVSFLMFIVMLTLFWSAAMLVATGIAAVVHNYFQRERWTPRWFKAALTGAIGVLCGAFLLGSLAQPTPTVVATSSNGMPTVHLGVGSFSQSSITIAKGAKLALVDDGDYHHNISNGQWVNGQPAPQQRVGAPIVNHVDVDGAGKSFSIGPFSVAGTYHLYCSIHSGMMLTIIVQ